MKRLSLAATALAACLSTSALAVPVQWNGAGSNGHYYEFISPRIGFDAALAAAASMSHLGQQGYLATVTSAGEQAFIFNSVTKTGVWFSGSDRDLEGTWKWLAGPEAGSIFWANGLTVTYANWAGGEPNNVGNEDFLFGNWSGSAWNDIPAGSLGYVVEFGGLANAIPEPGTWALMIGGFGMAGAAMRRRRTIPALA